MQKSILIFFGNLLFSCGLIAQITYVEPFDYFRPVFYSEQKGLVEVFDPNSNHKIGTLDLVAINPFGNLDIPIETLDDEFGTPVYLFDSVATDQTAQKWVSEKYHPKIQDLQPFRLFSRYMFSIEPGNQHLAVLFKLFTLNKDGINISTHSVIYIFNSKGERIDQTPLMDINIGRPVVTGDGRLTMYMAGGPYGWHQDSYMPDLIQVFDFQKDSLVYTATIPSPWMNIGSVGDHLFRVSDDIMYGVQHISIFDFQSMQRHELLLHDVQKKLSGLVAFDEIGMLYKNALGEHSYKYTYQKDFTTKKLIEK